MILVFAFLMILNSSNASAAPCCAGSSALPSLITGDESGFLGFGISSGEVIADVPGAGKGLPVFRDDRSNTESRRNFTVNAATLLSDRWQTGVSIPVIQNAIGTSSLQETHTRLGDVSATIGFEALPEYEYSEWKPRVFTFAQWVIPTGRAIENSQSMLASDVSGLGVHQVHLGAAAIKRWSDWDAMTVAKLGKEFSRASEFFNFSVGGGYSFAELWRAGMSLDLQYQSPMTLAEGVTSQKLVWNTGATLTRLVGADSSVVLGYSDQTLFGPAINTTLARTFSFSYQQRFER